MPEDSRFCQRCGTAVATLTGSSAVRKCMADAVIEGKQYSDVTATIKDLIADATIPQDQVRTALIEGWSQGAEQ